MKIIKIIRLSFSTEDFLVVYNIACQNLINIHYKLQVYQYTGKPIEQMSHLQAR